MGVNSLPKTVIRQRRDCDLNPGPSAPESGTLTTRLPSHPPDGGVYRERTRLAWYACVSRLKVPGHIQRAGSQLPQLAIHHADAAAVWLPRATRVEHPDGVGRTAHIAEVTRPHRRCPLANRVEYIAEVAVNAAAQARPAVAGRIHENDVVASLATGRKRLVLAELVVVVVTRQGEPRRRTCWQQQSANYTMLCRSIVAKN